MRDVLLLAIHFLVTCAKLVRPGGARAVAAESLLLKHQLLISNRARRRAPNLTTLDRFLLGLTTLFLSPRRVPKLGALIKPATLLKFHRARKLGEFRDYYDIHRVHRSLGGTTPAQCAGASSSAPTSLHHHAWRQHCQGLFQTPIAA